LRRDLVEHAVMRGTSAVAPLMLGMHALPWELNGGRAFDLLNVILTHPQTCFDVTIGHNGGFRAGPGPVGLTNFPTAQVMSWLEHNHAHTHAELAVADAIVERAAANGINLSHAAAPSKHRRAAHPSGRVDANGRNTIVPTKTERSAPTAPGAAARAGDARGDLGKLRQRVFLLTLHWRCRSTSARRPCRRVNGGHVTGKTSRNCLPHNRLPLGFHRGAICCVSLAQVFDAVERVP
jgi:hypothetical protein